MIRFSKFIHHFAGCKFTKPPKCRYSHQNALNSARYCSTQTPIISRFRPQRALVVSKLTKYEFEKLRHPEKNPDELERFLRNRGTDYEAVMYYHNLHKSVEHQVAHEFQKQGLEVKVVTRLNISPDSHLKWADIIIPVGGDGTFLLAAGRSSPLFTERTHTPVIGFNSDPKRSEGRLMLPKQYTTNVHDAVKKILIGDFKWMRRSRIRITLVGSNANIPHPIDLHEYNVGPVEHKDVFVDHTNGFSNKYTKRMLPYLALNEVFIGETVAARVSHLHVKIDNADNITKTKSSGLCVSTGTGSTSWLTSINRLSNKNVEDLIEILKKQAKIVNGVDATKVADEYNDNLVFPSDDDRLCYSIREQVVVGVWPNPKGLPSRGFASKVFVKSRCIDASLVIDGSIAYAFNDGSSVLLEIHPGDALLTVNLNPE